MGEVDHLALWNVLARKGTDEQRVVVRRLVDYAAPLLDRVIETFPTYTLHDTVHARKVAELMADLLGPRLEDLSALEAAMLVLSAFFHDIGMVFKEEERANLPQEPEWKTFLERHPDAFIAVQESGVTPGIAEWYCRWRHADRVVVYLDNLRDEALGWGVASLREPLAALCRSHSESPKHIADSDLLETRFLVDADLKLCAVLLRLADILDFDRERSPDAVYGHLGLARRDTARKAGSDVEWRKHLASDGFRFPPERPAGYPLDFIASPDEPAVEHDLRRFLDTIDAELKSCTALLTHSSERWRSLALPGQIDRRNIKSKGYRFGEHRFTLDQQQVLDLLMGENLYETPYAFVRELLQNAIDTSRHRRFFERARGEAGFEPAPIRVSQWRDRDGYQWVRFDDSGMGMDEDIIGSYLLRVGSSYYNTPRFRAEVLRARQKGAPDFVPISRFGIGLLSCFVAGDRVEITTLHMQPDGNRSTPVRLSMNGPHGFYTLQTPALRAAPMPARGREEDGYRKEPGTSVAVRLDSRKERGSFNLRGVLEHFLLCPPVPVEFEGERIGGDPAVLIDQPWGERKAIVLTPDEMQTVGKAFAYEFVEPLTVELVPVDVTRYALTPELKGQLLLLTLRGEELDRLMLNHVGEIRINAVHRGEPEGIFLTIDGRRDGLAVERTELGIDAVFEEIVGEARQLLSAHGRWLAHNGVRVAVPSDPAARGGLGLNPGPIAGAVAVWGLISLADSLRPDVSVSRDEVHGLSWRISSHLNLAFCRALRALGYDRHHGPLGGPLRTLASGPRRRDVTLADVLQDELLARDGPWADQPVIPTSEGRLSLKEIHAALGVAPELEIGTLPDAADFLGGWSSGTVQQIAAALVRLHIRTAVRVAGFALREYPREQLVALAGAPEPVLEGEKLFPPLAFVPFSDSDALSGAAVRLNRAHPFARWLIDRAPVLSEKYPGILDVLRSHLFTLKGYGWKPDQVSGPVNEALARLADLDPDLAPPRRLFVKPEDFAVAAGA